MPTPISVARECLTEEAARTLDDAVNVARRRSHTQTTSLHAVSALFALPSSSLREACLRARGCAYSPRLHFRALELSVGVSLDRLPLSKEVDEPPVANALMAAIKRSQANQRRHPDSFHLHQIHNQHQTPSLLKVELKHFILSIFDDPTVSRVFAEAGFRTPDIKLAILHPPITQVSRFSRNRCLPIFLCNLVDSESTERGFSFPFPGGFGCDQRTDENCRRIGEIMVKKSGKNPLLIGVCASDALSSFAESVNGGRGVFLAPELSGLSVICVGKEILEFVVSGGGEEKIKTKFKEVSRMVENCLGPGIVVNFGELNVLVRQGVLDEAVSFVVSQLTGLLKRFIEKFWVIGSVASYETYSKFLARFPGIEKDWGLCILPITSSSKSSIEGSGSQSSLMQSFVPFGGLISTPSNFKTHISSQDQSLSLCHQCSEKCEEEVAATRKVGSTVSVADQYSENLPPWLQMTNLDTRSKVKDDPKKKWSDICRRLHHNPPFTTQDISRTRSEATSIEIVPVGLDKESTRENSSVYGNGSRFPSLFLPHDSQENLMARTATQADLGSGYWFASSHMPNMSPSSDQKSSWSLTSVTTDLRLGTLYASTSQNSKPVEEDHEEHVQNFSGFNSAKIDERNMSRACQIPQNPRGQFDPREFKSLLKILHQKVGWQDEAILTVSEAISRCRSGNGSRHCGSNSRGDTWLCFLGPDKIGKKKIASALAEVICGSGESLISVDMSSQDRTHQSNLLFSCHDLDGYDVKYRGKTIVDYVAGELRKKPHSVVFLENVHMADHQARKSLSQAIKRGKFPDSHGREISINNMIFITTSTATNGDKIFASSKKEAMEFSEEEILKAQNLQMKISVGCGNEDFPRTSNMNVQITPLGRSSNLLSMHKRKLIDDSMGEGSMHETQKRAHKSTMSYLDLNLPVEVNEEETENGDWDSDCSSEGSESWMQEFLNEVDEKVNFKPFDFNRLAEKLVKEVSSHLCKVFESKVRLTIDYEVMVQMLAAAWLSESEKGVENWVEQILQRSFVEAKQRYQLNGQSVLKLVACEGVCVEEQASGVCLPARINLN